MALRVDREGKEVAIVEPLTDRDCFTCGPGCGRVVACGLTLEHERQEQVAALRALARILIEQPLGTPQPPARRPQLTLRGKMQSDPQSRPDASQGLTCGQVPVVGPLERADPLVVPAEHVRGQREPLEILWRQRRLTLGA